MRKVMLNLDQTFIPILAILLLSLGGCATFEQAYEKLGDELDKTIEQQCMSEEMSEALSDFIEAIEELPEGQQGGWIMILQGINMYYLNLLPHCEPICIDC